MNFNWFFCIWVRQNNVTKAAYFIGSLVFWNYKLKMQTIESFILKDLSLSV